MKLSIIMPVYDEQETISDILRQVRSVPLKVRIDSGVEVELEKEIIVIEDGDIIETGSHDELLDAGGKYTELHQSQYAQIV